MGSQPVQIFPIKAALALAYLVFAVLLNSVGTIILQSDNISTSASSRQARWRRVRI